MRAAGLAPRSGISNPERNALGTLGLGSRFPRSALSGKRRADAPVRLT